MSFHGGFLGVVAAVFLFGRRRGIPLLSLGDVTAAVYPIGHLLGRIANFINAELWGRPTDVPWAMVFPGGGPFPRHPSQLYQAALEGLLLLVDPRAVDPARRAQAAGPGARGVRVRLRARHAASASFIASPTRSSASCGAGSPWACCCRSRSCSRASASSGTPARARLRARAMTPLEAEIRRIIAADGPIPVAHYMALALAHPRARLLHDARSVRRGRRLRHRAGDQPDVRRAHRPVGRSRVAADGLAAAAASGRARARAAAP